MEIILADAAGMCFGVKRALDTALRTAENAYGAPVTTLGPLIHNPQVVDELKAKGIQVQEQPRDIDAGVVIIRCHGVPPKTMWELEERGLDVVDATCPFVKRAMRWAKQLKDEGYQVVIVGDESHPEVNAILGASDETAWVVKSPRTIDELPSAKRIGIIAQTTQSTVNFRECVGAFIGRVEELKAFDTICTATEQRQSSARNTAAQVDVMVVVGGRNSANTRRLVEVCQEQGTRTHHVETAAELSASWFRDVHKVGVTAGASTPNWLFEGVLARMSEFNNEQKEKVNEEMEVQGQEVKETDVNEEAEQVETVEAAAAEKKEIEDVKEPEVQEEEAKEPAVQEEPVQESKVQEEEAKEPEVQEEEVKEPEVQEEQVQEPEVQEAEAPKVETEAAAGETAEAEVADASPEEPEMDQEDQMNQMEDMVPTLTPGDVITGKVVQVSTDEVLVDIGYKSEGRIPLNELSFRPNVKPEEVLAVGDEVEVKVLKVDDAEGSVVLSRRRAEAEKAWEKLEGAYENGEILEATVAQTVKGGLLVDVGVRGFIPASHVSRNFVDDLDSYIGKTLRLKIIEFDRQKNNVVFSHKEVLEEDLKQAKADAFAKLEEGSIVPGVVRRLTDFGAFVDIGSGVEGLLHVSEIAHSRINHPSDVLEEGQEINVMVLGVDVEKERISLGLKQTLADPWETIEDRYAVGDKVDGVVTRTVDFGAFVKLEDGVEGLVHISQLAHRHVAKVEEVVNPGDEVEAKVISLDPQARRIGLSIRELEPKPEQAPRKEAKPQQEQQPKQDDSSNEELTTNLGDVFGDLFKRG